MGDFGLWSYGYDHKLQWGSGAPGLPSSNPHTQRQTPGVPSVPACLLRLPMGLFPAMESGIRAAWLHSSCKSVIPTQKWLCKLQVSSPDSHQTPEMDTHQNTCLRTKVESTIDKNTAYTVRHHKTIHVLCLQAARDECCQSCKSLKIFLSWRHIPESINAAVARSSR